MKPAILALMRPNNYDLIKTLHSLNKFDIILTKPLEGKFKENMISCDSLSKYFSADVIQKATKAVSCIMPQWEELIKNNEFQNDFSLNKTNYFHLIKDDLNEMFHDQSSASIFLIEAFKNLYYQKNLCLVLVWTDVINDTKTITHIAQKYGVKVMQLMHGAFGTLKVGNFESDIYSDKVAAYGQHRIDYFGLTESGNRVVLTGDPEKDRFFNGTVLYNKENVCRELGLNPDLKIVFFGSTWTGPFTMGSFRNIQEKTIKNFFKAFSRLQQEDHTIQLAIKLHPTEYGKSGYYIKLAEEAGVKNYRIFESHLYELLYICDIYTGFRSSIIINALIFNKPVLMFDFYEISDYRFFEGLAIKWIRNPDDIYPNLKTYLYDEDAINEIKKLIPKSVEYFNYKSDGQATKRVIDLVCEMAEETLSSPVKETAIDIRPSKTVKDSHIFEHIDFAGKKILFINSRSYLDLLELNRRRADAAVVFVEEESGAEDSGIQGVENNKNRGRGFKGSRITEAGGEDSIHYLDMKDESIEALGFEKEAFDCIVFKQSLETLYDPWKWLKDVNQYLKPDGKVLIEIANIRNMNVFSSIINGYFTYADEGIVSFDKIRFFTPAELSIHVINAGYEITDIHHFMDASFQNNPPVVSGQTYTFNGNNFSIENIPGESLVEMQAVNSLLTLKQSSIKSSYTSPLNLAKPESYYENPRMDLIEMMDKPPGAVLEIGCGIGTTCSAVKNRYPECRTIGIDIDEESVAKAAGYADAAFLADIGKTELSALGIEENSLDYILYGDVLEHLENPWEILRAHKKYLKEDGQILASIPNIRHYSVLLELLFGHWRYLPSGILDITHLRFFTLREIKRLFRSAGLYIYDIKGNPDLKPQDLNLSEQYSSFSFNIQDLRLLNIPREEVPEFSIIQFRVRAGKEGTRLLKEEKK